MLMTDMNMATLRCLLSQRRSWFAWAETWLTLGEARWVFFLTLIDEWGVARRRAWDARPSESQNKGIDGAPGCATSPRRNISVALPFARFKVMMQQKLNNGKSFMSPGGCVLFVFPLVFSLVESTAAFLLPFPFFSFFFYFCHFVTAKQKAEKWIREKL